MTENKRFVSIADTDLVISIKDNLTKRYPFSEICDDLIQFNSLLNEVTQVCDEMNKLWEQTQRFEDHNKRLMEENEQLKTTNTHLKNELSWIKDYAYWKEKDAFNKLFGAYMETCDEYRMLVKENEQLKSQLYYDEEEGVCNICKHHYLVKDDESEWGYYNSRCKKGHYECARVSLKHCEDFEKELKSE